ncbi:MAG: hypothetical protein H6727_13655 [Myxococcales bacterium]|nr:hypothetical protein [Myxococcales bacterium]
MFASSKEPTPTPPKHPLLQTENLLLVGWILLLMGAFAALFVMGLHLLLNAPSLGPLQIPEALPWCLAVMVLGVALISQHSPQSSHHNRK